MQCRIDPDPAYPLCGFPLCSCGTGLRASIGTDSIKIYCDLCSKYEVWSARSDHSPSETLIIYRHDDAGHRVVPEGETWPDLTFPYCPRCETNMTVVQRTYGLSVECDTCRIVGPVQAAPSMMAERDEPIVLFAMDTNGLPKTWRESYCAKVKKVEAGGR